MRSDFEYVQWNKIKNKLIHMYPTLNKSDLIWRNGSVNDMLETISSKLGISAKELKENIDHS